MIFALGRGLIFKGLSNNLLGFFAAAVLISAAISIDAQAPASQAQDVEKLAFAKCWSVATSIDADSGISADNNAGYFADGGGKVSAVDLKTGGIFWTSEVGGSILSNILVTDRSVLVAAKAGDEALLRSLSLETGLPKWSIKVSASDRVEVRPTEKAILLFSFAGEILALSESDGSIRWQKNVGEPLMSASVSSEAVIVLGKSRNVQLFDAVSGSDLGRLKVPEQENSIRLRGKANVLVSDERGSLTSFSPGGVKNWKFKSGGRIGYMRLLTDKIIIGSADNFVYLIDSDRGNVIWKRRLPGRIANGGLIGDQQAIFSVVGERTAYVIDLSKGRITDLLNLVGEDSFLFTPIRANGSYLLAGTSEGLTAFAKQCSEAKKAAN